MNRQTLKHGLWTSADYLFRFGVQFALAVVLARLLSPADFGVYALTLIFASLSQILIDGGFSTALIQRQDADHRAETAVFLYNILVAGALATAIAVAAPFIARAYGHPVLQQLLYASAAILFLGSFGAVPAALLLKRRRFDLMARIAIVASVLGAMAGASAAFGGAGVWTFTIQAAVSGLCTTTAVWLLSGWRPARSWSLRPARSLAGAGSAFTVASLLEAGYSQGYPLLLGRLYGAADIGYFNRAQNLQQTPGQVVGGIIQRMLLPTLAGKLGDPAELARVTRRAVGIAMGLTAPAMVFLAMFSDIVIRVVFGHKWAPSVPVMTILAIGGVLLPLHIINIQVTLAHGRMGLYLRLEIAKKLLGLLLVFVGCFYGLIGLAVGQLAYMILAFPVNAAPVGRLIGYPALAQLRDAAGPVLVSLACAALLRVGAAAMPYPPAVQLPLLLATYGPLYLGLVVALRIGPAPELARLALRRAASPA